MSWWAGQPVPAPFIQQVKEGKPARGEEFKTSTRPAKNNKLNKPAWRVVTVLSPLPNCISQWSWCSTGFKLGRFVNINTVKKREQIWDHVPKSS